MTTKHAGNTPTRRSHRYASKQMLRLSAALFSARGSGRLSELRSVVAVVRASGRPRVLLSAPGSVRRMRKTLRDTCSSNTMRITRNAWHPTDIHHRNMLRRHQLTRRLQATARNPAIHQPARTTRHHHAIEVASPLRREILIPEDSCRALAERSIAPTTAY